MLADGPPALGLLPANERRRYFVIKVCMIADGKETPRGKLDLLCKTWQHHGLVTLSVFLSFCDVRILLQSPVMWNFDISAPGPYFCSGSVGASVVAHSVALSIIEIAFSTLDCSIVPTCGAWGSATAAKRGPLKQFWAGIQHSRDDEPLGVLMQMRNVRVNGFFYFLL